MIAKSEGELMIVPLYFSDFPQYHLDLWTPIRGCRSPQIETITKSNTRRRILKQSDFWLKKSNGQIPACW